MVMFDTHCHLNFSRFKKNTDFVIRTAKEAGVSCMVVPGTDVKTSRRAINIAQENEGVFCSVGIHPHHAYSYLNIKPDLNPDLTKKPNVDSIKLSVEADLLSIESLLSTSNKIVAIGEAGMDQHEYEETVYNDYKISNTFINLQQHILAKQIKLALKYDKSLILHNRKAKNNLLHVLRENWNEKMKGRAVFHCCEANNDLLNFAIKHSFYIGVDGDVTYDKSKQDFIKEVPLEILVVETDAPFLLPEPLKSAKLFPNEPKNLNLIIESVAKIKGQSFENISSSTFANGKKLFRIA